jgi:aryl-alcohol dehydrogenase-like predicted oxidoreductase
MPVSRRDILRAGAAAGAALSLGWKPGLARQDVLHTKAIPSSGERVPVVGLGARNYRLGEGWESDTTGLRATLRAFHELGGTVLDTSPNYGASEQIVGDLLDGLGVRDDLFLATKVDREERDAGVDRMEASFDRLRTSRIELMQVHNLRGWATQLPTMREWQATGRIRYLGITTSSDRQYEALEGIMRQETLDFVQVDYALDNRTAADRLLPLALDRGMAVLVNMPFGRGRLFRRVGDRPLPEWAAEIDCTTWAQFFLKYVVSHPAVTAAIPGTTIPEHAADNNAAARGRMPTPEMRTRMEALIDAIPAPPRQRR